MTPTQKLIAVNRIIKNRFNNLTTDDSIVLSDSIVQALEDGNIEFQHKDIKVMGKLESIQALQKIVWEYEELKLKYEVLSAKTVEAKS
jgi:hypothetical protein